MLRKATLLLVLFGAAVPAHADVPVTLRGSPASMVRQNQVAKENDYSFLDNAGQVKNFVEKGHLVRVEGNADFRVAGVSFPYARPELHTFIERLAAQHREGCGERLVVTSLTRPRALQPTNAHQLSVHPTGMAVDLRVSQDAGCRAWLENALLALEKQGILDATRERTPPHYHVAVFPGTYRAHLERLRADSVALVAAAGSRAAALDAPLDEPVPVEAVAASFAADAPGGEEPGGALSLFALAVAALGLGASVLRGRALAGERWWWQEGE